MKDLDFDELDRAVSSLMGGVPKAEPAKDDDVKTVALQPADLGDESNAGQTTDVPASVASTEDNDTQMIKDEPRPSVVPAARTVIPPAARRGRFMDMVRPTTPESRKPTPSQAPSRHGATVEPSAGFASTVTSSVEDAARPSHGVTTPSDSDSSTDWPDPLAAIDFNKTTEAVTVKATMNTPRTSSYPGSQADSPRIEQPSVPLTSPFLPDAKVEKRPLGRVTDSDVSDEQVPEPAHAPVTDAPTEAGSAAEPKNESSIPEQPLPVELGQEVMAIESDTSGLSDESAETPAVPPRPVTSPPVPTVTRPVATSIPQQYKVQPKVAEPSSGAIYDTAAYHQPLSHPAKKQPGWLWVMAIILILALGAASGAAVYFFGLI